MAQAVSGPSFRAGPWFNLGHFHFMFFSEATPTSTCFPPSTSLHHSPVSTIPPTLHNIPLSAPSHQRSTPFPCHHHPTNAPHHSPVSTIPPTLHNIPLSAPSRQRSTPFPCQHHPTNAPHHSPVSTIPPTNAPHSLSALTGKKGWQRLLNRTYTVQFLNVDISNSCPDSAAVSSHYYCIADCNRPTVAQCNCLVARLQNGSPQYDTRHWQ